MSTMEPDEGAQPDEQKADAPRWDEVQETPSEGTGSDDPDADRNLAELCRDKFEGRYPPGAPLRAGAPRGAGRTCPRAGGARRGRRCSRAGRPPSRARRR